MALYRMATSEPYGFLYCDLMAKDPFQIFHDKNFQPLGL